MSPSGVTASSEAPFFVRWLPRCLTFLGLLMLLHLVTPTGSWLDAALNFLWTWVVPVTPIDFVSSVVLILLAGALSARKRLAWRILVILLGLTIGLYAAAVAVVAAFEPTFLSWDLATGPIAPIAAIVGLVVYRRWYTARTQPRGFLKALGVLAAGLVLTLLVVLGVQAMTGGLTMVQTRQILAELFGVAEYTESSWMLTVFGFGSGASIIVSFWILLRSIRESERISIDQEREIRIGLANYSSDSLGYFGTRRDRSALFVDECVLTYRVQAGVCLVASDPIGPPAQWPGAARAFVAHAEAYGWVPAVLAASKQGARAYHEAGLKVLQVGDEAVLHPDSFSLAALPDVQRAVSKLTELGYTIRIRRQGDLPAEERDRLASLADAWRSGDVERGFSMALGRFGDPADAGMLFVEALFPDGGDTAGLLGFVPWGASRLSLDVMRRHPDADNGITDFMVAGLMRSASDLGIAAVSLNFAVFRSAFEQGAEFGAGPMKRLWRNVLLFASRFWQLESLYRANQKYHPRWVPRMLCYPEDSDLARIGLAVSLAEGFLNPPRFLSRKTHELPIYSAQEAAPLLAVVAAPRVEGVAYPEQVRHRMEVRESMLAAGVDPYPAQVQPGGGERSVEGRVLGIRDHGGVVFLDLRSGGRDRQLVCERDVLGVESLDRLRRWVALGDLLHVEGRDGQSRNGTASVLVDRWTMASKALRPWPHRRQSLTDPETRVRQRYLDLAVNTEQRDVLVVRSLAIRSIRESLEARRYLEVETPILQAVHGGANARPFSTHINAYDLDLYLRIAPELYLKRLLVGGFERIFEIGRNFRNEGADATHNPEFSMLEAYEAGGDYLTMRDLTRDLVISAARDALGTTLVRGTVGGVEHEIDLAQPWRTISLTEAVSVELGEEVTTRTSLEELRGFADRLGLVIKPGSGWGVVLQELYEELAEPKTIAPTFYIDFPAETSPLTRQHRREPLLAEKWDLIVFGSELGTAYSELLDPVVQRARLTAQSMAAANGNPEAMELDEDFLTALEYGMPPAGGLGMGLDRLVMLLTQRNIRSTIAFPLARPQGS